MIGRDEKMMVIFESIRTVAKTDLAVLVLGPTGSGKEVVARIIHELSSRQHETFQAVNCAALPDSLFESEVFGYERGAFTGAYERKPGRIELANHGTLFLDEVGDLSPHGAGEDAARHRGAPRRAPRRPDEHRRGLPPDLRDQPAARIPRRRRHVPRGPLLPHQRASPSACRRCGSGPSDIPVLADRFLARYCAAQGLPLDARRFAPDALTLLVAYPWPGNIRELETTVSRAALSGARRRGPRERHAVPPPGRRGARRPTTPLLVPLRDVERDHIRHVLDALDWNKKRAAQVLQISRETLYRKIGEFALVQERRA